MNEPKGQDALNTALNTLQETVVKGIEAIKSLPNVPPAEGDVDLSAQVDLVEGMTAALEEALTPAEE